MKSCIQTNDVCQHEDRGGGGHMKGLGARFGLNRFAALLRTVSPTESVPTNHVQGHLREGLHLYLAAAGKQTVAMAVSHRTRSARLRMEAKVGRVSHRQCLLRVRRGTVNVTR